MASPRFAYRIVLSLDQGCWMIYGLMAATMGGDSGTKMAFSVAIQQKTAAYVLVTLRKKKLNFFDTAQLSLTLHKKLSLEIYLMWVDSSVLFQETFLMSEYDTFHESKIRWPFPWYETSLHSGLPDCDILIFCNVLSMEESIEIIRSKWPSTWKGLFP